MFRYSFRLIFNHQLSLLFPTHQRNKNHQTPITTPSPFSYLDPLLLEVDLQCELFPEHDVRIMSLLEGGLELLELLLAEDGPVATLPLRLLVLRVVGMVGAGVDGRRGGQRRRLRRRRKSLHVTRVEARIGHGWKGK